MTRGGLSLLHRRMRLDLRAGYDIGPGEVSTFEDASVKLEVLNAYPNGSYRVPVTRK